MKTGKREITKEQYDRAMDNHGHIIGSDEKDVFGLSILCGYGLYGDEVYTEDGKYYVKYQCGDSCD